MYRYLKKPKNLVLIAKIAIPVVLGIFLIGGFWLNAWYRQGITALDTTNDLRERFTVDAGMSVSQIADQLETAGLIRSSRAFVWYVKTNDATSQLQAGTYGLGPAMTVAEIVRVMSKGLVDTELFTFLPGRRLDQSRQELLDFGFTATEVDTALHLSYSSPVLADKPSGSSLEGYLFPDSYEVTDTTGVDDIVSAALENFYAKIMDRHILEGLQAQGMNLNDAVILASIIEKEAGTETEKAQVAQVFLLRLEKGMPLGADATFVYAAEIAGVEPQVDIDSPYNTRTHSGLPPGPIANFNISSLEAVAYPASGDYLYFVTGDDGVTRFSRTFAEHQALVESTCQQRCLLP